MRRFAVFTLAVTLCVAPAWSCPTCAAAPVVLEPGPPATTVRFSSVVSAGSDRLGSGAQALHRTEGRLTLTGLFAPADGWLILVGVPLVGRSVGSADDVRVDAFSMGDIDARVRLAIERGGWLFAALSGAKLPSAPQLFSVGTPRARGYQLGTGSIDPFAGVFIATYGENWTLDTTVLGAWPLGGWGNRVPGRSLRWELGGWQEWSERWSARLALEGRLEEPARVSGTADGTSGGLFLFVAPQVFFKLSSRVTLTFSARWCLAQQAWGAYEKGGLYSAGAVFDL